MCPSYMVTRDEMHTTRGRANLLRLAMTGELPAEDDGLDNETLHEALDLCLQCKACKTECPSKVDMAKLKAEVLHQHYQNRPRPLGHLLLGQIFRLNPIAAATAPLTNRDAPQPGLQMAAREGRRDRPPADPADVRTRPFPQVVSPPSRRRPAPASGEASSCSTTASRPTTTPRSASRRCGCWKPSGYRVELAGLDVLRPAGDLQGPAPAGARAGPGQRSEAGAVRSRRESRSSAASRAAW